MMKLVNGKTIIEYDAASQTATDCFYGCDLTDQNNLPACYSKTRRTHKKAIAALIAAWDDQTTMYDAVRILRANGIKMHTWCRMD